jgi:antitoxin ParD1/3/4
VDTMNISLSDPMREFVDDLIRQGSYPSASEYVRELIRVDRKRRAKEHLESLLLEGIESGPAAEMTAADWEAIRTEVRQRLAERCGVADGEAEDAGR